MGVRLEFLGRRSRQVQFGLAWKFRLAWILSFVNGGSRETSGALSDAPVATQAEAETGHDLSVFFGLLLFPKRCYREIMRSTIQKNAGIFCVILCASCRRFIGLPRGRRYCPAVKCWYSQGLRGELRCAKII